MATANKIATKEYCNTLIPGSFSSDLNAGVTAAEASAAGFSHNSTPAKKCVKETNLEVRTVTFTAADLTPFLTIAVEEETNGGTDEGPDSLRRFAIGSIVMLDTVTFKLKLFAFMSVADLRDNGIYAREYDGTRFIPLGIVVGVPANEYYERSSNPGLYGTMCGGASISCLTVMSLRNFNGALMGLNQGSNLPAYSEWMVNNRNNFLDAACQLGMDPIDIYNPIAAICKNPMYDESINGLRLSEFQYRTDRWWSIFPIYKAASEYNHLHGLSELCSTDPISIKSDPSYALGLNTNSIAMTSITGLKYQMPLATMVPASKGMGTPMTVNMDGQSSNSMAVSGIGRCLPFDSAHYDTRCTDTSYELCYTGKIIDFRLPDRSLDKTDGLPCRTQLLTKPAFFNSLVPQVLLSSPYSGDGTGFNETGAYNKGLLFYHDDFRQYVSRTATGITNSIPQNELGPSSNDANSNTFCLPTGATYEAFLITQKELTGIDLSFWQQTQLYQLIRSYTGNNDSYFSLYTPSLYELFKTTARWRFITANIQQLSTWLNDNQIQLIGYGLASCEMDDTLLSDNAYLSWVNTQILSGSWPTRIGQQLNAWVTRFNSTTAQNTIYKTCGRLGVHCLQPSPTATTERNSQVLMGTYVCSCPYLWTNAQYNSSIMLGYCDLIPFIRIPVDFWRYNPAVQAIWNTATIV